MFLFYRFLLCFSRAVPRGPRLWLVCEMRASSASLQVCEHANITSYKLRPRRTCAAVLHVMRATKSISIHSNVSRACATSIQYSSTFAEASEASRPTLNGRSHGPSWDRGLTAGPALLCLRLVTPNKPLRGTLCCAMAFPVKRLVRHVAEMVFS